MSAMNASEDAQRELKVLPPLPQVTQTAEVPPQLFFVWLGGGLPNHACRSYKMWQEAAQLLSPEIRRPTPILVDERGLSAMPEGAQMLSAAREVGLSARGTADLARILLVHRFGGVYLDLDTIPLRLEWIQSFAGSSWIGKNPTEGRRTLTNAHFGFRRADPFLAHVWALADAALERGVRNDHYVAGPRTWRKALESYEGEAPTLRGGFPTITSGPLTRTFARAEEQDTEHLRWKYNDSALLHVIYDRSAVPEEHTERK